MRWSLSALMLSSAAVILSSSTPAYSDATLQSYVEGALTWLRNRDHNPGIAALVQIDGKVAAEAAKGSRALDHSEPVTVDDRWHIGSCTKAFTATLIAILAERRVLSPDDTLEASFPGLAKTMHPAYRHVTVRQLLSHTAGLPPLSNTETEFPTALAALRSVRGVSAQRAALARYYLTKPPTSAAGTLVYSNLGYVIVGAIAETHTGKTWEQLLSEFVFGPLGIATAAFGAPGHSGQYDQPLGHVEISGKLPPLDVGDSDDGSPAWIGPAGTLSISLKDWALFAQDQLDGAIGHGRLLKQATYRALQTPVAGEYALGWGVVLDSDGAPTLLNHIGSNGYWVAEINIYPKKNTIILAVTNIGTAAANKSIRDFSDSVNNHLSLGR
jgi:CubicO group peptidase (beta-lactamase class C family)